MGGTHGVKTLHLTYSLTSTPDPALGALYPWPDDALMASANFLYVKWRVLTPFSPISNDALTNLNGLSGITSLGGYIVITEHTSLENLDGLSGITSVGGGRITIEGNDVLTNLDGLGNVTSLWGSGSLYINDNTVLPDCEVCELIDQFATTPGTIDVENNLDDTCTPVPGSCP